MKSLEEQARLLLDAAVYDFVAAGAGTESGLAANMAGWQDVRLRPRRLVDVSDVSTAGDVLGVPVEVPVLLAPAGLHRLLHVEVEQATARGASAAGTAMCLATRATTNVQDVVPFATGRVWLQVYVATDRGYTSDMLRAAIAAGVTGSSPTCSNGTSPPPRQRQVGRGHDENPTDAGEPYLATVIDRYSRRLLGAATGLHPDSQLARERSRWPRRPAAAPSTSPGSSPRPRLGPQRREVHHAVPPDRRWPVDGPGRLVLR